MLGSTRLVVEAFANPFRSRPELSPPLPGEGMGGGTLLSFSLDSPRFFGLENSFIFELFGLGSFSGGGPGGWKDGGGGGGGGTPGDGSGALPFGKATFAAVAAASLLPPSVPLEYGRPPAEETCGL